MNWIWIWVSLFAAFLILESVTARLMSIWFAAGAAVAIVISLIAPELHWLQITVFIVVSVAALIATRPFARKLQANKLPTNADRNIGSEAVVTSPIGSHEPGAVKVNGLEWTAVSDDGKDIGAGEIVIVKSISGAKMTVVRKTDG